MSRVASHYCHGGADRSLTVGTRAKCATCQPIDDMYRREDRAKRILNHENSAHKRCAFKDECQCGCVVCDPKGMH